jgi:SAM-dependent methyltransferase
MPAYTQDYYEALKALRAVHGEVRAMELIVGGNYLAQGILEKSLLIQLGLPRSGCVVDVGCGSGRLAFALRDYLSGPYIGTDILSDALAFATAKVQRQDWQFVMTEGPKIAADDRCADIVCFFSVFTHLQDEDCFRFLTEAKRVVKPGGLIVFSFLDFEVSWHWPVFERSLRAVDGVLNRFHAKSMVRVWSGMLDLGVERLVDGPEPWIELTEPAVFDDGRRLTGLAEFGQSVVVLRAPRISRTPPPRIDEVVTELGLKHW